MIVTLDTSVLIAAFVAPAGTCASVIDLANEHHALVLSDYILDEYARKLVEKFDLTPAEAKVERAALAALAGLVRPLRLNPEICRDSADAPVLGTALAAKAAWLVSGDKDLLVLKSVGSTRIVTPREFLVQAMPAS